MNKALPFVSRAFNPYLVAALISLLLSAWMCVRIDVVNPDAICYLYSAEEIGQTGLHAAMHLCPQAMWPFYSSLIFGLVKLTSLSYFAAACLINAVLTLITVLAFLFITQELGGEGRTLWLAALVILSWHTLNSVRDEIIRDHGYWAFYLVSFYFFLRFFHHASWRTAFAWSASLLVATLFRIEGAFFLLLLPFLSWFAPDTFLRRAYYFFLLNLPLLGLALVLGLWLFMHPSDSLSTFGRLAEIPNQLHHGVMMVYERFQETKATVSHDVLSPYSSHEAGLVLILTFIMWYLVEIIANLSWIYTALLGYAWLRKAAQFSRLACWVIAAYLVVNFLVTFGFFTENLFLAKRYLIAMSLIWLVWVPFALEKLCHFRYRMVAGIAVAFILISTLGTLLHIGPNKRYIHDAGDWLALHVPKQAKLYANDYQLMYYSNHFGDDIFQIVTTYKDPNAIMQGGWKKYDYIALLTHRHQDQVAHIMQEIHLIPEAVFVNVAGDRIYIYKISHGEKKP